MTVQLVTPLAIPHKNKAVMLAVMIVSTLQQDTIHQMDALPGFRHPGHLPIESSQKIIRVPITPTRLLLLVVFILDHLFLSKSEKCKWLLRHRCLVHKLYSHYSLMMRRWNVFSSLSVSRCWHEIEYDVHVMRS